MERIQENMGSIRMRCIVESLHFINVMEKNGALPQSMLTSLKENQQISLFDNI